MRMIAKDSYVGNIKNAFRETKKFLKNQEVNESKY